MSVLIFAGPTLPRAEVEAAAGFLWRPPVAQGDVWRALAERPRAIGIVDGYFEGRPAVWHKEILWALTEGTPVFGAASMGALRAAELHGFGMQGVGTIFEQYRDGILDADDEVAVLHGPAETGFVALSEPLVNIRASLARAEDEKVLDRETHLELLETAKALHYKDRTWPTLLAGDPARPRLADWLPTGRVDRKRLDAVAMLEAIGRFLDEGRTPEAPAFRFVATAFWQAFTRAAGGSDAGQGPVLDELRLDPAAAGPHEAAALQRLLLLRSARERGARPTTAAVRAALTDFRRARGLARWGDLEAWCRTAGLEPSDLETLIAEEALAAAEERALRPALAPHLVAVLRLAGRHAALARRAQDKARHLAAAGLDQASPDTVGITPTQLRLWYFEQRLRRPLPDDLDGWIAARGFAGRDDFHRLLLLDWLYETSRGNDAAG